MQKTILISVSIVLVGIALGVLFAESPMYSWRGGTMFDGADSDMMDEEQQGSENMVITSERSFIERMIPHHEEAIRTAGEVLERGGTNQGMVDLANNIISSQTVEMELMKRSYEEWFGKPYADTGGYQPMMRELAPHSGAALDRIFLHDMSMHHMGAIMMSRSVQPYLQHDVMRELTGNIIVNQSREIETMQQLSIGL